MRNKLILLICLFGFNASASAENSCPEGMTPFQNGGDPTPKCYPIQGSQSASATQPRGRWETRWGAVATDRIIGSYGVAKNASTKRKAEKGAVTHCKRNGGGENCTVIVRYYNQCAAIAWGDAAHTSQSAENIEVASQLAFQKCSEKTSNCKVVYADCSLPVWVQ
jgi:hypothetical protein